MIKTEKVREENIDAAVHREEQDGWEFVSATQSSPPSSIGEPVLLRFSATYLLFFRKKDGT